nr:hypothetical protein [Acidimicrobiia bacterium]
ETQWIVLGEAPAGRSLAEAVAAARAAGVARIVAVSVDRGELERAGATVESVDGPVVVARVPAVG